jgi:opacity protein-like surface antigen
MFKKLGIFIICITLTLASSLAFGADGGYVSGDIGFTLLDDATYTEPGVPDMELEHDPGYALAAALGYQFANARVEWEISYQENDFDKASMTGVGSANATGDMSCLAFLINGYYDFHNQTAFTPFISAGLGIADVDLNDFNILGSGVPSYSADDTVFAYQMGAGVGYAVNEKVTIEAKYRYFATDDPEFDATEGEFASHNFMFGVRYSF